MSSSSGPGWLTDEALSISVSPSGGDDTSTLNVAIASMSAAGGGVVTLTPGTYHATQVVLKRGVLLDGGSPAAVCLQQIAATNTDFITSENFAILTGTGDSNPLDATVPSFFGVKDLRIDASGQTSGTPRGIAWYGNAQYMVGTVIVESARGHNIYTEASQLSEPHDPWQAHEEGVFDTVISRRAGGKGWHFRGPHNSQIRNYLCLNGVNGDWAFHNESGATYSGVLDFCEQFHAYSDTATNLKGFLLEAGITVGALHCDGVSLEVDSLTFVTIHSLLGAHYGMGGAPASYVIQSSAVAVHHWVSVILDTGGITCLTWAGGQGYLGSAYVYDSAEAASTIALDVTGSSGQFDHLYVEHFTGAGSIGVRNSGAFNTFAGVISNCKTCWSNTGASNVRAAFELGTAAGQAAVAGNTPVATDRVDLRGTNTVVGGTDVRVLSSNAIAMDSTALQTVTLAHQCLYTPTARNVLLTFTTPTVTDFVWAIPPYFVSADATNLTIKCKLATASATGGSKGDVIAHVRMGA